MPDMAKHERKVPVDGVLSGAQGTRLADRSVMEHASHDSTAERIRVRAYELYLERGTEPDDPLDDWLRAEREFRQAPDEATEMELA
jgi:hypothetical protein